MWPIRDQNTTSVIVLLHPTLCTGRVFNQVYREFPNYVLLSTLRKQCVEINTFRFKVELIYYFTYYSTVVPYNICVFLSSRLFVVNTTFSTVLWVLKFLLSRGLGS